MPADRLFYENYPNYPRGFYFTDIIENLLSHGSRRYTKVYHTKSVFKDLYPRKKNRNTQVEGNENWPESNI